MIAFALQSQNINLCSGVYNVTVEILLILLCCLLISQSLAQCLLWPVLTDVFVAADCRPTVLAATQQLHPLSPPAPVTALTVTTVTKPHRIGIQKLLSSQ